MAQLLPSLMKPVHMLFSQIRTIWFSMLMRILVTAGIQDTTNGKIATITAGSCTEPVIMNRGAKVLFSKEEQVLYLLICGSIFGDMAFRKILA